MKKPEKDAKQKSWEKLREKITDKPKTILWNAETNETTLQYDEHKKQNKME